MIEIEKSLLGCILSWDNKFDEVFAELDPGDFTDGRHRTIYSAMGAIRAESEAGQVDLPLLTNYLRDNDLEMPAGDPPYVYSLIDSPTVPAMLPDYVAKLKEASALQQVKTLMKRVDADRPAMDILASLEGEIKEIRASTMRTDGFVSSSETMKEVNKELFEVRESSRRYAGLDTGFNDINSKINGLCGSELTVIAARPSIGKTTLCLQIARNVAIAEKTGIGFFALEMSRKQLMQRLTCMEIGVSVADFRAGKLEAWELEMYEDALPYMSDLPLFIDDTSGMTIPLAKARMQNLMKKENIGLWIFDYLQLMEGEGSSENEQVNSISKGLKAMAKDCDEPVIVMSQLNRSVETRFDKRPQLADLRGSGGIEQDADNVMMIYRPGFYPEIQKKWTGDEKIEEKSEILCLKTRFGPTGEFPIKWDTDRAMFRP